MPKLQVTDELILSCLPDAPSGMRHSLSKHSARVWKVLLAYPSSYAPLTHPDGGTTVWGFVKSTGAVCRPKNHKTPGEEVCHILDAGELSGYSSIVPKEGMISDQ